MGAITIRFNGVELSYYLTVNEIGGRGLASRELTSIDVPYRSGAYFLHSRSPIREIPVSVTVVAEDQEEYRKKVDELNTILITKEPVPIEFSDEYDRTYYGVLGGASEMNELRSFGQGELTFVCHDPYKYGIEKTRTFVEGVRVTNEGAEDVYPQYEITPTEKVTFVDIFNENGDYMRIGEPIAIDETAADPKTRLIWDEMTTFTGWTNGTAVDNGAISGVMKTDGYEFYTDDFGTGSGWHGPARKKSIGEPVYDFTLEVSLRNLVSDAKEIGRAEVSLLDDTNAEVAKVAVEKRQQGSLRNYGIIQAGGYGEKHFLINWNGEDETTWTKFDGRLRITRRGDEWEAWMGVLDKDRGAYIRRASEKWTDTEGTYTAPVTQVQTYVAQHGTKPVTDMAIKDVKVFRWNEDLGDSIPYIASPDDIITYDFSDEVVRINGEDAIDLKDFGATYWPLKSGQNRVFLYPTSLNGKITWRERYL